MRPTEIIKEINQLELSEKLTIVETIWDSIAERNTTLPLPAWQKSELNKRYANFKANPEQHQSAIIVHENLRRGYK